MRYDKEYFDCIVIYDKRGIIREEDIREISINNLKYNTFELIEDEEIDIQSIEELRFEIDNTGTASKIINELVKAVKQLDKRTRKEQSTYNQISKCSKHKCYEK